MEKEISSETLIQGIRKFKTKLCKRDIARALRDRFDLNTLYLLLLYWNYKLALSFLLVKTFFLQKLTKLFVRKMMLSFLWSQVLGDVKFCSILTLSFVWRSSFACQVSCGHWSFVWMSSFVVTSWKFCVDIKFYEDIKFYVHVIRFVRMSSFVRALSFVWGSRFVWTWSFMRMSSFVWRSSFVWMWSFVWLSSFVRMPNFVRMSSFVCALRFVWGSSFVTEHEVSWGCWVLCGCQVLDEY